MLCAVLKARWGFNHFRIPAYKTSDKVLTPTPDTRGYVNLGRWA